MNTTHDNSEQHGIVTYDTPRGQITLTIAIVRKFFCPKATELEALAFAGYCKHTGLNPFLREVYLVKYDDAEPASIIVAYQSFMKRAERAPGYGGFRAGIVIAPVSRDAPRVDGDKEVPGIPSPFVAIEGTLVPPEWTLVGGWAVVSRDGRPPVVSTVRLDEYLQRRRDGKPTRAWDRMPATMIRKVPIGQAHRDAWPDELAGLVLEEEGGATITDAPATEEGELMPRRVEPTPEPVHSVVPDPPTQEAPALPAETASRPRTFALGTQTYRTAGITESQLLASFALVAALDKTQKGLAKAMLKKEFGLDSRVDLTETTGEQYLIRLREVLGLDPSGKDDPKPQPKKG